MRSKALKPIDQWTKSGQKSEPAEPGYREWLESEIEAGLAQLDTGKGIPAEDVWKSLDLE